MASTHLPKDCAPEIAELRVENDTVELDEGEKDRNYTIEKVSRAEIKDIVEDFLRRCEFVETTTDMLANYEETCTSALISRGYIALEDNLVRSAIPVGSAIGYLAYGHLADERKLYISLCTALLTHLDDAFEHYIDPMKEFNRRFVARQPQKHGFLDRVAAFLSTTFDYFDTVAADLIVTSVLEFIISLVLEYELKGVVLEKSAISYVSYDRNMSGLGQAYALFIFAPNVPFKSYIHAVPDIMFFIGRANDVLSFYKEELAGEQNNYVQKLARCRNIHPSLVLRELANEVVAAHHRILETLKPHAEAYTAFTSFSQGYILVHWIAKRYRLDELTT